MRDLHIRFLSSGDVKIMRKLNLIFILWRYKMTRTKSSRALLSVVLAVLMAAAFMPSLTYSSFAATAKKATKVTKLNHTGAKVYGKVGSKYTLKYKLSPSKLTSSAQKTVWKSSDSSVVKVIATRGKHATVKVKSVGTAKITVYTKANTKAKAVWSFKTKEDKTTLTGVTVSAPNAADPAKEVKVGTELQASVAPTDAKDVTYQWYADGAEIKDATSSTFTVTTDQIGKAITVKATSKNDVTSTATAKVADVNLSSPATVKVYNSTTKKYDSTSDKASVGQSVKVTVGGYDGDLTKVADIQWVRVSTATNGNTVETPISGATSQTYTFTKDDINSKVEAVVTPKTGVNATGKVQGKYTSNQVTVNGALSVEVQASGKKVTAVPANTALTAVVTPSDAQVEYQWLQKDGNAFFAVAGARSATYTPSKDGTYKVRVTVKDNTYGTTDKKTYDSDEVVVGGQSVEKAVLKVSSKAVSTTNPVYTDSTVTAEGQYVGGANPSGATYKWYLNGTEVKDQNLATLNLATVNAKAGDTLKASVTAGGKTVETDAVTVKGDITKQLTNLAITVDQTNATITVQGLPVTDVTIGTDYTVTIQKFGTKNGVKYSLGDVATVSSTDKTGKASVALPALTTTDKDYSQISYAVVVKGAGNYVGEKTVTASTTIDPASL